VSAGASPENPHAGHGMVVLDIGGDVGALVVSTPGHMAGVEIEICPAGARGRVPDEGVGWWEGSWRSAHHDHAHGHVPASGAGSVGSGDHGGSDSSHSPDGAASRSNHAGGPAWPHVGVLDRALAGVDECAAVFPGLRAGSYDLWIKPDQPTALTATVVGGEVATVRWPA
jgi:hypothetical protein